MKFKKICSVILQVVQRKDNVLRWWEAKGWSWNNTALKVVECEPDLDGNQAPGLSVALILLKCLFNYSSQRT